MNKDIDFETNKIFIRHIKTKRALYLPLSSTMKEILIKYMDIRKGDSDDSLFCDPHGKKLSPDGLTTTIKRYNKNREVKRNSIHIFRNTFACHWLKAGGDRGQLQKILGHSTPTMTNRYVEWYDEDYEENFETFNPLERMKKKENSRENLIQMPSAKRRKTA